MAARLYPVMDIDEFGRELRRILGSRCQVDVQKHFETWGVNAHRIWILAPQRSGNAIATLVPKVYGKVAEPVFGNEELLHELGIEFKQNGEQGTLKVRDASGKFRTFTVIAKKGINPVNRRGSPWTLSAQRVVNSKGKPMKRR